MFGHQTRDRIDGVYVLVEHSVIGYLLELEISERVLKMNQYRST